MKRFLAFGLALLCAFALTGCGGGNDAEVDENKPIKIGVIFYGQDDALGKAVYSYMNYAAEVVDNLEVQFCIGAFDAESQRTDAENLIAAGCQGILALPIYDLSTQQIMQVCEQNGVYYMSMFRQPQDETVVEYVNSCEYWLGSSLEDDSATSYEMVKILSELGDTVIGAGSSRNGSSLARMDGFDKGVSDFGITVCGEFEIGINIESVASDTQNMLDSYPDMQALWSVSAAAGIGETMVNLLRAQRESTGKNVHLITYDTFTGMTEAFQDDILVGAVGGTAPLCIQCLAVMYNAIDGHPLTEEKLQLNFPYLIVTNEEDLNIFETYYGDTTFQVYTEEAIKSMLYRYNPDVTLEGLNELWSSYSIDYLKEVIDGAA
ncbi:MAG: substrate-binding domain-containing protein [Clostridia bacterium]|nr:substrate-binding domain-containing protein [Clostridia bacterium]